MNHVMTRIDISGSLVNGLSSVAVAALFLCSMSGAQAEDGRAAWTSAVLQSRCTQIVPAARNAANANDVTALEIEAAMYDRGCGVVQNMRRAEELYVAAIAHGATGDIAEGYVDLYGPNPSEAEGIAHLAQAVEAGNRFAAFDLYFYYVHRLRSKSDAAVAFHWASIAANGGDAVAAANLGGMYLQGTGVEQNFALGRQYESKAMAANIPDAFMVVGNSELIGSDGYPKDHSQGVSLLRKAIALGLTRAKMALAVNADKSDYAEGRVTGSETAGLAENAAQLLMPKKFFDFDLAEYWYIGGGRDVPDCARAMPLLLEVEDLDIADPDYDMSYCYYNGDGIPQNQELGLKYMQLAAQKGSPNAIAFLNSRTSGQNGNSSNSTVDSWRNYEGYHWNELHPMSGQPATGPH